MKQDTKPQRVLILRANYQNIFAAALMASEWDHLEFIHKKAELPGVLEKWIAKGTLKKVGIILANVLDPEQVYGPLSFLVESGARGLWFGLPTKENMAGTYREIHNVELIIADTVFDAVVKRYPSCEVNVSRSDRGNPDLMAFGAYKIAWATMEENKHHFTQLYDVIRRSIEKPFTLTQLNPAEARIVRRFRDENCTILKGNSKRMIELRSRIMKITPTELSVLILGDTGTGKETVAVYLHEFSQRRDRSLVSINCAGLEEGFLRSELFGHLKGAYTGAVQERKGLIEVAEGGTLFLDELHEMPLAIQSDLLRFLETRRFRPLGSDEEKEADIRIVAGALPRLLAMVGKGTFRPELYYRLANVQIQTPALSEISEDIFLILKYTLWFMYGKIEQKKIQESVSYFKKGIKTLQKYTWPGNVRELLHYAKRRLYLGDDVLGELQEKMRSPSSETANHSYLNRPSSPGTIVPLEKVSRDYISQAYKNRGSLSQQELAARLGISVNTLKKYLKEN